MYEKLKRKSINPQLQDAMPSPQQQQQQQPPPVLPHHLPHHPPEPGTTRLYQTNTYARPPRSQHNHGGGPPDEDLMSRFGRASNITTGRSVFVPPPSPTAQSHHSRHHRSTRIPSPSIAPDNSLFSYRHHPPRRDSMDRENQMPPTASDFYHQRQPSEQQLQPYQHKHRRKSSPASHYYHKFVDTSRHK